MDTISVKRVEKKEEFTLKKNLLGAVSLLYFSLSFCKPIFLKSHCNKYKQQISQKYWRSPVFMPMVRPA